MTAPLLDVRNLVKRYAAQDFSGRSAEGVLAVDDVSFTVAERETFGLVGESGCGKSTAARCILRLHEPTSGQIFFQNENLLGLKGANLKKARRNLQIVFQDPYSSLDPRMSIRATLLEPYEIHRIGSRKEREEKIAELIRLVGLPDSALARYPHEFSGGQRQRIGIARALALSPRLVVADEPVSALDLSVRAQVINLLAELQERLGLAYLLIAHDLTLVRHVCHRVAVMRRGRIVELAETEQLFSAPAHPYTRRLLDAIPIPDPARARERRATPRIESVERDDELSTPLRELAPGHFARV